MATGKRLASLLSTYPDVDAVILPKGGKPQALPVEEILRQGQGDAGALGGKCGVSHDVALNGSTNVMRGSSHPPPPGRSS